MSGCKGLPSHKSAAELLGHPAEAQDDLLTGGSGYSGHQSVRVSANHQP